MAGRPSLADQVEAAFADDGPLARALDAFEPREGQRRLALAVADVLDGGGTLVAEAGTGTGKTLAYLVPAALAGRKVLISTGTRTLQDQIFYKDIPALAAALGRPVKAAYMKGRTNFLCLHRYQHLNEARASLPATDRTWLDQITEWAEGTETGDRAEIEDLPDDFPLWNELTASSEQCLGRDCPQAFECYITRMRDRAAEADVVIVNHHLLCADAAVRQGTFGEVIPECDALVVDEAHQLEDVVTQYFGIAVSTWRVDEFVRDAARAAGTVPAERGALAVSLSRAATDVQSASRHLFDQARLQLRQGTRGERVTVTPEIAQHLQDPGRELADALTHLVQVVQALPEPIEDLTTLAERAAGLIGDVVRLVAADDSSYVYFIEARGRGASLRAAPIEVSALIRDAILGDRSSAVLTSATLTVERSFDYVLGRLGTPHAHTLRLPSEFDFTTQAVLFLPSEMPDPRSREYNPAVAAITAELLERTEGRAFVLFTSYAAMHEVREIIAPRLTWPLLVQGQAPRSALLRDFRATPNAVLLATASFWQGVDVAGEALSCVIIDRLPFASPGDPIVAARIQAIQARGGHAFNEFQVPLATLTLLQGLGRLIRTRSDRGVLAILDPRLTRMGYGRRFLASLPPAPITDDLERVREFLGGA
ncbi:MAG: ATP-dependent DNA helicase [Vicinamibacterales bacterium]